MSAVRVVPVKLQEGKRYVLRDGTEVEMEWDGSYFNAAHRNDDRWYYANGGQLANADPNHAASVARPVYAVGETYNTRNDESLRVEVVIEGNQFYPLDMDNGEVYALNGLQWYDRESNDDLMDYAPAVSVQVERRDDALFVPSAVVDEPEGNDGPWPTEPVDVKPDTTFGPDDIAACWAAYLALGGDMRDIIQARKELLRV